MSTKVGTAYVVVKAITRGLGAQIGRDVTKAVQEAQPEIDLAGFRAGQGFGDSFLVGAKTRINNIGDQIGEDLGRRIGDRAGRGFTEGLRDGADEAEDIVPDLLPDPDGDGPDTPRGRGRRSADNWAKGFVKRIKSIRVPPLAILGALAVPAVGGALKILGAYVAQATALVSTLGPVFAGAGAAAGGFFAAAITGFAGIKLALATDTPMLTRFKASMIAIGTEWKSLGAAVQTGFLPALGAAAQRLTDRLLPMMRTQFTQTGKVLGGVVDKFAAMASTPFFRGNLATILGTSNKVLGNLGDMLTHIVHALVGLLAAARPVTLWFGHLAQQFGRWLDNLVTAGVRSGRLEAFFRRSIPIMRVWGHAIRDLFIALKNIFLASSDEGKNVLKRLADLMARFRAWTESLQGQNALAAFFRNSREIVIEVNGLIGDLFKMLGKAVIGNPKGTVEFIRLLRTNLVPALGQAAGALSTLGPSLIALGDSFGQFLKTASESGALGTFTGTLKVALDLITALLKMPVIGTLIAWAAAFAGILKVLTFIPGVGTLISLALSSIGRVIVSTVLPALYSMATAAWAAAGPWALIIIAIVAIVAAIVYAWNNFEWFRDAVKAVWDAIYNAIQFVWDILQNVGTWIASVFIGYFTFVFGIYKRIWDAMYNAVQFVWDLLQNVGRFVATVFVRYIQTLQAVWSAVWGGMVAVVHGVWDAITGFWNLLVNAANFARGALSAVWDGFKNAAIAVFNFIAGIWNNTIGALQFNIPDWVPGIGGQTWGVPRIPVVSLAQGGIVSPTPGGTFARIAEAGRRERVEPLGPDGLSERDRAILAANRGNSGFQIGEINVTAGPGERAAESLPRALRRLQFQMAGGA